MDIIEKIRDIWEEQHALIVIGVIAIIPTLIYYTLINQGYIAPFWIKQISIYNPVRAVIGIVGGVLLGFAVTNKWG